MYWEIAQIKQGKQSNLICASKVVDVESNTEKAKYMLLSRHQNARQNHNVKTTNRSFENGARFKYLGKTGRNQNFILE
jgi:hypothetical protein